jgi:hypothetical protein
MFFFFFFLIIGKIWRSKKKDAKEGMEEENERGENTMKNSWGYG